MLELGTLLAVRLRPRRCRDAQAARIERVQRSEERTDALRILVDERLAVDEAIHDEGRLT